MKYLRYQTKDNEVSYGVLDGDTITKIDGDLFGEHTLTQETLAVSSVTLLAPCQPSKIMAAGTNYMDHIEETNSPIPQRPLIFMKPSTSVAGPTDDILYPATAERVDFEGELGVVIGKVCKGATKENCYDYILGYTCLNDVSCRDMQWGDVQWTRGKSLDTFCPIGPIITDELTPMDAQLETRVNGKTVQKSSTNKMIFGIPELMEFISQYITLLPGDIIATGTPSGIAPMAVGDVCEVEIQGIGVITNHIVG